MNVVHSIFSKDLGKRLGHLFFSSFGNEEQLYILLSFCSFTCDPPQLCLNPS